VLALTLMEALGHMCMLKDREEAERDAKEMDIYINYQALRLSHPTTKEDKSGVQAREEFLKSITPRRFKKNQAPAKPKEYKWDFEKKEE